MKTIYQAMSPKQLSVMLNKSINAINKAIAKMVKINPDWKQKENGKVIICPDGVQWLCEEYYAEVESYSIQPEQDIEYVKIKAERDKYKELYEKQEERIQELRDLFNTQMTLALENQKTQLLLEYQQEYQHVFGSLYRKKKI